MKPIMHEYIYISGEKKGYSSQLFTPQRITLPICPNPAQYAPKTPCPTHAERLFTPLKSLIPYPLKYGLLKQRNSPQASSQEHPKTFLRENSRRIRLLLEKAKSYHSCGSQGLKGFWAFSKVLVGLGKNALQRQW